MNTDLFTPLTVGGQVLTNRIVMAPMTRSRANHFDDAPTELNAQYYSQRASAGLIITEGTQISPLGKGYSFTPGIYSPSQLVGWRRITQAVHEQGGKIAAQLWHVGRISHHSLYPNSEKPLAPSALRAEAKVFISDAEGNGSMVPTDTPSEMSLADIAAVRQEFVNAAQNAMLLGFDFIELHAANGYLFDQFLATGSNQRTDNYGGSVINRARFLLETVDAIIAEIGAEHIGVRVSPWGTINGIQDDEPEPMALYVAQQLQKRNIAYLHLAEWEWTGGPAYPIGFRERLRAAFSNVLMYCGNYDEEKANILLKEGLADAIAFGRPFISNPDFPERLRHGWALTEARTEYFYGGSAVGYTDYSTYHQQDNS